MTNRISTTEDRQTVTAIAGVVISGAVFYCVVSLLLNGSLF